MTEQEVVIERRGSTSIITLNRPAARNALNLALSQQVEAAIDQLEDDRDLRVAVLTGAGGTFCSGMDLKAGAAGELPVTEKHGLGGLVMKPPGKPIIAAVEGFALAGGFEMALACDLIVATHDAAFGIPEVKRGLVAVGGGLLRLAERLPRNVAMELALTGGRVGARRVHDLGLVNRLTEPGAALERALELAAEIADGAPLALTASQQILRDCTRWNPEEAWERQAEIAGTALRSADAFEGMTAFAQKRPPVWQGR